jgi:Protein of unknown function (DUF2380)
MTDRLAEPDGIRAYDLSKAGPRLAARAVCRIGAQRAANIGAAILLLACMASPAGQATPIAIVDFDYTDSSGEVQNQTAKHQALLQAFMASVRRDLTSSENYRVVALSCQPEPCSTADPSKLLGQARGAGATLLLYGGIHKMSTLVQWATVQVVDARTDKLVLDRLLSFRGDDDEAAEAFLAADLKVLDFSE